MNETHDWTIEAVLMHSNDIHSRLEHAAKIATVIAEERRTYGSDRVLAVDIGDHMDRMRVETEGSDGLVNIELLHIADCEAATLGNNEGLTLEPRMLEDAYRDRARFPVLVANMFRSSDHERPEWLAPSTVINKGKLRIGLIGVTAKFSEFYTLLGWEVTDPIEAIRIEAAQLRSHVDVLVVLSHLGLPFDRRIAEQLEGIDLILGGHTHHLLEEPLVIGSTTICAAGKYGEWVGRVEIGWDSAASKPLFRASCVPVAAYDEHPDAVDTIARYREHAAERLGRVMARLDAPLASREDQESPLTNLLAAGIRRWTKADIGIANNGQLLAGLPIGDVTAGDLHAICPSPINPCRMRLLGRHIREALQQSLRDDYITMPIRGFGFRGSVLGKLAVDGMTIEAEYDRHGQLQLSAVYVDGDPLVDDREYSVGTLDMFTFGVGYLSLKQGTDIEYFLPEFIRDILAVELQDTASIQNASLARFVIRGRAAT
ncbi:2',3'-cyclic-nucleotide 2'-phosphodiesterase (5'-nucleotidase family) [Paenibacillus cellulosilyticus]|uniref:2',3'-cyclic-nucleotide 2'-phosphodiesterase (5'-nucleotidase family) n=1 Tax=Paenibacillus cellulosilyticus TaxID=375489 RepID=A0A2V2YSL7_9BACL|nr:bifunctional UDP-sugar hydrolase/5'-nucleotidase [Paenibacillus cellulosilyticus]PWW01159.1 2',3'-cyclic-nucleotide 2'-phosphodiesterase (5'-nucleotidase family) [Paenibacillus cellulosilyticus]QKS46879.1 bifunctional metallophosphatase/5'-nucleotidase [Paenibacillus cellulosilyticus]